mgnify:CR=1 FL=1
MPTKRKSLVYATALFLAVPGCAAGNATPASSLSSPTPSEVAFSTPPADGGIYQNAFYLITALEKASSGQLCDRVTYNNLVVNGQDLGMDTFGACRLGLGRVTVHVFPPPVNPGLWSLALQPNMRGDYVIVYGGNWFINASASPELGEFALKVLGGDVRTAQ